MNLFFLGFFLPAADTSSQSVCPLESALMLLESMSQEFSIPQQDYKNVCTSIKEMVSMFLIVFFKSPIQFMHMIRFYIPFHKNIQTYYFV